MTDVPALQGGGWVGRLQYPDPDQNVRHGPGGLRALGPVQVGLVFLVEDVEQGEHVVPGVRGRGALGGVQH